MQAMAVMGHGIMTMQFALSTVSQRGWPQVPVAGSRFLQCVTAEADYTSLLFEEK